MLTSWLDHNHNVRYGLGFAVIDYRLHKPVSDWLKMLPHRISGQNMLEKFLLDIIEMERNDLWLNVKGNYIFFKGKIILN